MRKAIFFIAVLLIGYSAAADVRLPNIFGDNMVLQRHQPIVVWGWSNPKEKVTVKLNNQSKATKAGKDGRWKISLNPEEAGGPYQLTISGRNTVTFSNVLVGEVWICSGQSNMEWSVRNSNHAEIEILKANYPNIRHIKIPNSISVEPKYDITDADWKICSAETVGDFTAVGYFFARKLLEDVNVPIGLINSSWGGTHVETWISRQSFKESADFNAMIAAMPNLNLDSLVIKNSETLVKHIESLQGRLPKNSEEVLPWREIGFDDSSWPKMLIPGLWEAQALGNFDGQVWFRKSFSLQASDVAKEAVLELGMIDDADETFVNGVKVGALKNYNAKRSYTIPGGILKEGKNIISVQVTDTGGGGGIYGEPGEIKLTIGNRVQPLAGPWSYQVEFLSKAASGVGPNSYPTLLYNAMINPLVPYTFRGVLWYQGESNAGRAYEYRKSFPLLINDWRKQWAQGDFPFYFVQLASFNAANGNSEKGSTWAELREAQTLTLSIPNTGMVVTTDIGDPKDIHPRNKQDVGQRLAAVALHDIYQKNLVSGGPAFQAMKIEGNKAILTLTNIGSGLMVKDKYGYLKGFEIAGPDRKFIYAKAFIDGDKIVVHHESVQDPVAVRFGWADDASENNLFNKEGFPALPFRTDNWKSITESVKFKVGL